MNKSILAVVEDPGAANMVKDLPQETLARGVSLQIAAVSHAVTYLQARQVDFLTWESGSAEEFLAEHQPPLLLVGSSDNPQSKVLELVLEARKRRIPSIGLVDMRMNADRRFRGQGKHSLDCAPDYLIVPDTATANAFVSLGMDSLKVFPLGNPQYDLTLERSKTLLAETPKNLLKEKLFGQEPLVITFVAEPESTLNPALTARRAGQMLEGTSGSGKRCPIVLEEFLAALKRINRSFQRDPLVVLRLHPRNQETDFLAYESDCRLHSGGDPLELICASDLVVGMTSMLLLEAAIVGVPTLSIVPKLEEARWLPTVEAGITPCATRKEEIEAALAVWYEWYELSAGQAGSKITAGAWFEPGALTRIADFIETRLKELQEGETH